MYSQTISIGRRILFAFLMALIVSFSVPPGHVQAIRQADEKPLLMIGLTKGQTTLFNLANIGDAILCLAQGFDNKTSILSSIFQGNCST